MAENGVTIKLEQDRLLLSGNWTTKGITPVASKLLEKVVFPTFPIKIDGSSISKMDTVGAFKLTEMLNLLKAHNIKFEFQDFHPEHESILNLVKSHPEAFEPIEHLHIPNFFERVGKKTVERSLESVTWLTFIGEVSVVFFRVLCNPVRIRWRYLFNALEKTGCRATILVAFLMFLIGVVITYQIGLELRLYGANIFIVSLLGLAILREFAPLITAIILAGRTGSAITAQLGLMKVNEEIDALQTMGLSPIENLIIPRILGLIIALPLLTVVADIFGILGGMVMAKSVLGIGYYSFIRRFPADVTLTSFMIGICKAPVFAIIIAMVGCFEGLQVTGSSESIGWQTTKSVVLSIFMLIIVDALFSILLSWWGI